LVAILVLGVGCQAQRKAVRAPPSPVWATNPQLRDQPSAPTPVADSGQPSWTEAARDAGDGHTLIDLSDDFTPFLFVEHAGADGRPVPNRYRRTFVGLANDRLDGDGQPLPAGHENYLELYGIFPSFSVLQERYRRDAGRSCLEPDTARLLASAGRTRTPPAAAIYALERRLACEGLGPAPGHRPGRFDRQLQQALRRFQHKHMIYEGARLRGQTVRALSRDLLENNHRSFVRALRERVVAATGVIEDGTGSPELAGARNLADAYTTEVARALGVDSPQGSAAFLASRPPGGFSPLVVAVKLPPRPAHHRAPMDLKLVIDRGDVYYDLPFDETGRPIAQPRRRYPTLMLVGQRDGRELVLVRWRTTIGGWRLEQAPDGYEYYRYKGSQVGPRVIRQVVAGPAWLAPTGTPVRSLVKWKSVNGSRQPVVNYTTLGPGHLSAYGLVAGYLVMPGRDGRPDRDQGIRAHGSAEYLSMYGSGGYSHGCHRLPNHLALRLFSFLLRHRPMRVVGEPPEEPTPLRQFLVGGRVFEIRIASRGFAYQLDPPLPVEVRAGQIKGRQRQPIDGYVRKPGVPYPGPPPTPAGTTPEQVATAGP
jgi:hypothetical protein